MPEVIDTCPKCGDQSLVAVCEVIVEYNIANDYEGGQDWERNGTDAVDDNSSTLQYIKCEGCGKEWNVCDGTVQLENGLLVGLVTEA